MKTSRLVRVTGLGAEVWEQLKVIADRENNNVSRIIARLVVQFVNDNSSSKWNLRGKIQGTKIESMDPGLGPSDIMELQNIKQWVDIH